MFAKVIDEQTKECHVGLGSNATFYRSIGMTEMEVEQAYNGSWYVKGYAPAEPESAIKERHRKELLDQLEHIDLKSIRSLRAKESGVATQDDLDKLEELEFQAEAIRAELKELDNG